MGGQAEGWDREGLGRASPLSPRLPGRAAVPPAAPAKAPAALRSPRPRWLWDTFQTLRRRVRLRLLAARTHRPPAETQVRGNRPDVRSAGGALPGRTATSGSPPSTYVSRRPTPEAEAAGARLGRERRCGLPVVAAARWRPRRFPRCRRSSRASSTICEPRRSWTSASRWWRTTVSEAAAAPAPGPGPPRPIASRPARGSPGLGPPPSPATSRWVGRSAPLPLSAWLVGLCRVPVGCTESGVGEGPTSWGGAG